MSSNTVTFPSEAPEKMVRLTADQARLNFSLIGDEMPFYAVGIGESGKRYNLTASSRLSITSSDTRVVIVERIPSKLVSRGEGEAKIRIEYRDRYSGGVLSSEVPVKVEPGMKGDFDLN